MARPTSAEKELDDMTECSICTEVFTDPRVLPCIHTFCLKCLLNYGKDRQPGNTMPCPLCRKEFTVPDIGFEGIQKNFFMEKLLGVRKLSAAKEAHIILCDICRPSSSSDENCATEAAKPATVHCVQCQQNYCDQCSRSHAKMKGTADHVRMRLGKALEKEQTGFQASVACCEIHNGEEIRVFCLECKVAICTMCFIRSHKNHDCSDIEEVSGDLRKQVLSDTDKATESLKKVTELLFRFEKQKNEFTKQLACVEDEINKTADKLINDVQRDRRKLLSEVEAIRQKRVKQLETVKQELEQHMASLESFKRHSEMLLNSGRACDVARSATSLHDRADELAKFDVIGHVKSSLPRVTVKFTSSTVPHADAGNFIGEIHEDENSSVSAIPTVTHVIPKGNKVSGVTSLGDDVFVVRYKKKRVEVYDAVTLTLQRHLLVPGLGSWPFGLAVCPVNKRLYLSDFYNDSVHRVELSGSNAVMKWSVASNPVGLSVNSAQNVLVVSRGQLKFQEFTTRGSLVREIQLQPDIGCSEYVIQLSAEQFLVSHWGIGAGSQHRVCMVNGEGAVVRCYGESPGSDLTKLQYPEGLAVDKHGNVLVADQLNNRLLVLDQSLSSAHEMSVSVDGGLQCPASLCYDELRRRLYVGEWDGGRLIVIDNLNNFRISSV